MSLPARKQKGASRRRKKQARLRRVKRRLLGLAPWLHGASGQTVLADVKKMIALIKRDRWR